MKSRYALMALICAAIAVNAGAAETASEAGSQAPKEESAVKFFPGFHRTSDVTTPEKAHVYIQTRLGFQYDKPRGGDHQTSFVGDYFYFGAYGEVLPGLSYKWVQRLNRTVASPSSFFDATDVLSLSYQFNDAWKLTAGKLVVASGGYEYDAAPIDIYSASMFWNNLAVYQFGVQADWYSRDQRHNITMQITNSPYHNPGRSCYGYNLRWRGNMGWFSTVCGVNLIEYRKNHYDNWIALGARFDFAPVSVELDLTNRYASHQHFFFDDYVVTGKVNCVITPQVSIFAKGGFEHFRLMPNEHASIDKPYFGAGVEVWPIRNYKDLRLHATWNMNYDDTSSRFQQVKIGATWLVDLLSVK